MGIFHDKIRNTINFTQLECIVELFKKYGISEFRTPTDERQHYSKSQMLKDCSPEALLMATLTYRELISSLLWVSNGTRPDATYSVNKLTKFTSNPGLIHGRAVLRILGFLNSTKYYCIRYTQQIYMNNMSLNGYMSGILPSHTDCYVDSSHARDVETRRSITGYIFFISEGPVSWQSRMQTSVALSSMEAEYMAASAATQEAMWQAQLLEQMGMRIDLPIKLYEDNKSATMFTDYPRDHRTTKHIDTRK
jgi:hypothetical protein